MDVWCVQTLASVNLCNLFRTRSLATACWYPILFVFSLSIRLSFWPKCVCPFGSLRKQALLRGSRLRRSLVGMWNTTLGTPYNRRNRSLTVLGRNYMARLHPRHLMAGNRWCQFATKLIKNSMKQIGKQFGRLAWCQGRNLTQLMHVWDACTVWH